MYNYRTTIDAINDLKQRGYNHDFNLEIDKLHCPELNMDFGPNDFKVDEFYRFEGPSDPGDMTIVYAISAKDNIKGVLMNAYGTYAEQVNVEMNARLSEVHEGEYK